MNWKSVPVATVASLREFCQIGASCFRVPLKWFQEILTIPNGLPRTQ